MIEIKTVKVAGIENNVLIKVALSLFLCEFR